ncbi:hypothetical protein [Actinobaculum suis]|uniref:HD domain-containing protein n=1 Tax=Actinobaculum suis TaxID=1657 RepID=UPI0008086B02|nr:hypothetical protein [Actinobaculum suis]OCA93048.1 hypothetical protein ACU21_01750 [Actinobaculum suis]OCA93207.1 hypothetical protein ACU20_02260 [Actinobaculum suis]
MGEIPAWLPASYYRSVRGLGSPAPREQIEAAGAELIARWSDPARTFHGLSHVVAMLKDLEALITETHSPDVVRLAAWYHGVEFTTPKDAGTRRNPGENEFASALAAQSALRELDVPEEASQRVAELIRGMASKHPEKWAVIGGSTSGPVDPRDIDLMVLRDAHLAVLAEPPQRYRSYLDCLRREYSFYDDSSYYRGRSSVIQKLLSRKYLYFTPTARQWENSARQNLTAELDRILAAYPELRSTDSPAPRGKEYLPTPGFPTPEPAAEPLAEAEAEPAAAPHAEAPATAASATATSATADSATATPVKPASATAASAKVPAAPVPAVPAAAGAAREGKRRREEVSEKILRRIEESQHAAALEREVREALEAKADSPLRDKTLASETGKLPRLDPELLADIRAQANPDLPPAPTHGVEREPEE